MGQSAIQEVCCNQYKGTQLPLVKQAPTPICCASLIDCTVFLCWRETHCFLSFVFLLFFLFVLFFLLYFCPMLFTPEMRSSKYSSKWCGFLSCCLCPSVSACLFLPVGFSFLRPLVHFFSFALTFVWFFNFPVISGGHRAEAVWVVCLLPDGTHVNRYGWQH